MNDNYEQQRRAKQRHRYIARALLMGKRPGDIARRGNRQKVTRRDVEQVQQQLDQARIRPSTGLLTVAQAATVLGVIPRRARVLCQEGRIGMQLGGGPWVIQREELIDYLGREHRSGRAGREQAQRDKAMAAERYGAARAS